MGVVEAQQRQKLKLMAVEYAICNLQSCRCVKKNTDIIFAYYMFFPLVSHCPDPPAPTAPPK